MTERNVILEERRSRVDNDPGSILQEQMMAALYENHPYGIPIIGWEHEIEGLNRSDALTYYKRFYAPNNAILIVAGDVEPDEVKKLAEETYGKLKPNQSLNGRVRPKEPEHFDAGEGHARGSARRAHHRAEILSLAELCLGRSRRGRGARPSHARRGQRLGEPHLQEAGGRGRRRPPTPAAGIPIQASIRGRLGFYAIAAEGVSAEDLDEAIKGVIEDLREQGITQAELDRARASYLAEFVYTQDSQSRMARHYGWRLATGMTIEDVEEWPERLKHVTVDDVRNVVLKYLVDKNSVTGYLLPAPEYTGSIGEKPAHAPVKGKS